MAFAGEIGWIGRDCPDHYGVQLKAKIMQSAAGYFLGTQCHICARQDPSPNSRETGYYPTREALIEAFKKDKLSWRDPGFHPGEFKIYGSE